MVEHYSNEDVNFSRNAMLYWHSSELTPSVENVFSHWQNICPNWNVTLYSQESAYEFIKKYYGREIGNLFLICRIPAMQSDFFRVLWALEVGGVYMDLTYQPFKEPLFHVPKRRLTVIRWFHGRISNNLFYCQKGCLEMGRIVAKILQNVGRREQGSIWSVTGPRAWIDCIGQDETDGVGIVTQDDLFRMCIMHSKYQSSTRNTPNHWSEVEKREPIYAG